MPACPPPLTHTLTTTRHPHQAQARKLPTTIAMITSALPGFKDPQRTLRRFVSLAPHAFELCWLDEDGNDDRTAGRGNHNGRSNLFKLGCHGSAVAGPVARGSKAAVLAYRCLSGFGGAGAAARRRRRGQALCGLREHVVAAHNMFLTDAGKAGWRPRPPTATATASKAKVLTARPSGATASPAAPSQWHPGFILDRIPDVEPAALPPPAKVQDYLAGELTGSAMRPLIVPQMQV